MLHVWARCPECAKNPPSTPTSPHRHHALSATITRAWTEPHSTADGGGGKHAQEHTRKNTTTNISKNYIPEHTHTHSFPSAKKFDTVQTEVTG